MFVTVDILYEDWGFVEKIKKRSVCMIPTYDADKGDLNHRNLRAGYMARYRARRNNSPKGRNRMRFSSDMRLLDEKWSMLSIMWCSSGPTEPSSVIEPMFAS